MYEKKYEQLKFLVTTLKLIRQCTPGFINSISIQITVIRSTLTILFFTEYRQLSLYTDVKSGFNLEFVIARHVRESQFHLDQFKRCLYAARCTLRRGAPEQLKITLENLLNFARYQNDISSSFNYIFKSEILDEYLDCVLDNPFIYHYF